MLLICFHAICLLAANEAGWTGDKYGQKAVNSESTADGYEQE